MLVFIIECHVSSGVVVDKYIDQISELKKVGENRTRDGYGTLTFEIISSRGDVDKICEKLDSCEFIKVSNISRKIETIDDIELEVFIQENISGKMYSRSLVYENSFLYLTYEDAENLIKRVNNIIHPKDQIQISDPNIISPLDPKKFCEAHYLAKDNGSYYQILYWTRENNTTINKKYLYGQFPMMVCIDERFPELSEENVNLNFSSISLLKDVFSGEKSFAEIIKDQYSSDLDLFFQETEIDVNGILKEKFKFYSQELFKAYERWYPH